MLLIIHSIGREICVPALGKALGNRGEDRIRDEVRGEISEEEELPKSTKIHQLLSKLSWAVNTLTIHILVVIISVANLATATCLIEAE